MTDAITRLNTALHDRYTIERELGEGGMATVYLAEDLRHERRVAVKVLKPELAAVVGADRFLAEIKTTANLQHPHILPLFDSGEADGFLYYVMPYVEGESLREKLDREGELPVEEAVRVASAIASALDYAHRNDVIHRDIKPANILLHDGQPLVADFGIALAVSAAGGGRLTETGLSLGTPYYMSPEQATAERDPDPRSDVYALGCVLYEMLVGEPPYTGSSAQAVLGKVLTTDPVRPTEHRRTVPGHVEAAVLKALEKRPADRFGSAAELSEALQNPTWVVDPGVGPQAEAKWGVPTLAGLAVGLVVGAIAVWGAVGGREAGDTALTFLPLSPAPGAEFIYDFGQPLVAISPDGQRVVYTATSGGMRSLYLQDLGHPDGAVPIPGTDGGGAPFFSPDGGTLGFFAANALKVVSLTGGDPRTLDATPVIGGGVFSSDGDTIYYNPGVDTGIWKVPVTGGTPIEVTRPLLDGFDNSHRYPEVLPGDKLLYTSAYGRFRLFVLDLSTGKSAAILESETAFYGRYAESGHVIFAQPGGVMAAQFDPQTLETGVPFEVLPEAVVEQESQANFAVSKNGTLVYLKGISAFERTLTRVSRAGDKRTLRTGGPQPFSLNMNASPDGDRIALALSRGGQQDVFAYDLVREDLQQIITEPHNDFNPIWSRDGTRLVFSTARAGILDLYSAPSDRESLGEPLVASAASTWPGSFAPGDTLMAFESSHPETRGDIWLYSERADSSWVFRSGTETEAWPRFSPDGRWLAFQKGDEAPDVFVVPFPGPGPECKISMGGGAEPRWSQDGNELFYRSGGTAMVANVADRDFCGAESVALFDGLEKIMWTVAPDGSFFVTVEPRDPPELWLVQNWFEVLERADGENR